MGRKLQTIYEYFSDYTVQEIDDMICSLSMYEKCVLLGRYGKDLHNPEPSENWSKEDNVKFYGTLIPKMKRLLLKRTKQKEVTEISEQNKEDEQLKEAEEAKEIEQPKEVEPAKKIEQLKEIEQSEKIESTKQNILITKKPQIETIDCTSTLLQALKDGKSNKEICENLNISSQELWNKLLNLKNKGIMYQRSYYSDGSIEYNSVSALTELKRLYTGQDRTIITDSRENSMKLLVISDLHFGNELERIDLINRAYNYCAKNGINIILCGGDIIDGTFTQGNQKISNIYQQIIYFIKNYPYDKNILTFSVGGDHDMSAFRDSSLNIIEMCNNYRHDIIIGGYNNTAINLKNDQIHLYHHIEGGTLRLTDAPIILHGHSHKYTTEQKDSCLNITIPSLSDINQAMPSALELDIYFDRGYISNTVVKHLFFGEHDIILGESSFNLLKNRKINYEPIRNIESYRYNSSQSVQRTLK